MIEAYLWAKGLIRRERVPFAWLALQEDLQWSGLMTRLAEMSAVILELQSKARPSHG